MRVICKNRAHVGLVAFGVVLLGALANSNADEHSNPPPCSEETPYYPPCPLRLSGTYDQYPSPSGRECPNCLIVTVPKNQTCISNTEPGGGYFTCPSDLPAELQTTWAQKYKCVNGLCTWTMDGAPVAMERVSVTKKNPNTGQPCVRIGCVPE